ncbi:hypothetical protein [Streptomyces sp. NPDC057909]|uniref:hypothetical protein n=1 Tax=Streptomyces sp. NPDC057909 TaxID=3346277 RepID=UPI0036E9420E
MINMSTLAIKDLATNEIGSRQPSVTNSASSSMPSTPPTQRPEQDLTCQLQEAFSENATSHARITTEDLTAARTRLRRMTRDEKIGELHSTVDSGTESCPAHAYRGELFDPFRCQRRGTGALVVYPGTHRTSR